MTCSNLILKFWFYWYFLVKIKSLTIIISIIRPFWRTSIHKTCCLGRKSMNFNLKSIDLLILWIMDNNHLHHMHIQVNNIKFSPYWNFLTWIIQINYCIYSQIIKTITMTLKKNHTHTWKPPFGTRYDFVVLSNFYFWMLHVFGVMISNT